MLKSQNYVFRVHWLTIFKGKNPWDVSRKSMVLNDFIKALHEDEKELASKYKDERGTDWNAYVLDKEKSGFCKFDEWYFMDYSHITTQMDSKYKAKWGTRVVGVTINDRKVDVQLFAGGFHKVDEDERRKLIDMIKGPDNRGNELIREIIGPYEAAGHGVNFCVTLDNDAGERSDIMEVICNRAMYNIKALTAVWMNHNLMVLVLHEDASFF